MGLKHHIKDLGVARICGERVWAGEGVVSCCECSKFSVIEAEFASGRAISVWTLD